MLNTLEKKITDHHSLTKHDSLSDNHKPSATADDELNYIYDKDYVENNLIAYIGNKKRLLSLIVRAIKEVEQNGSLAKQKSNNQKRKKMERGLFIDYFAGTGVVSRLAKSLGYRVIANDWEPYAHVINRAFLELDVDDLKQMFVNHPKNPNRVDDKNTSLSNNSLSLDALLEQLNSLVAEDKKQDNYYISRYYCPKDDNQVDIETERIFYTHYNGVLIDNIRARIDELYQRDLQNKTTRALASRKKNLLLALLLLEASKRSNTSGVFKGFHQGFGGRGADALTRILKPITLTAPKLHDAKTKAKTRGVDEQNQSLDTSRKSQVFKVDAKKLADKLHREKNIIADIVYLDPPYNQHQYGSNYHLLNTIALNDKPKLDKSFWIDGKKLNKSGIRKDWIKTRSPYCYKDQATASFKQLVESIKANYILVSYSTEGIIDFNEMLNILASKGKIGIITSDYVRYRGGRQSNQTKNKNLEFLLAVDTNVSCSPNDKINIESILLKSSIYHLSEETFPLYHEAVIDIISQKENLGNVVVTLEMPNVEDDLTSHHPSNHAKRELIKRKLVLTLNDRLQIEKSSLSELIALPLEQSKAILKYLKHLYSYTNSQEIEYLACYLKDYSSLMRAGDANYFLARIKRLYKKINPKKDASAWRRAKVIMENLSVKITSTHRDKANKNDKIISSGAYVSVTA